MIFPCMGVGKLRCTEISLLEAGGCGGKFPSNPRFRLSQSVAVETIQAYAARNDETLTRQLERAVGEILHVVGAAAHLHRLWSFGHCRRPRDEVEEPGAEERVFDDEVRQLAASDLLQQLVPKFPRLHGCKRQPTSMGFGSHSDPSATSRAPAHHAQLLRHFTTYASSRKIWGWTPPTIMVAHIHISVNTSTHTHLIATLLGTVETQCGALACVCAGARGVAQG